MPADRMRETTASVATESPSMNMGSGAPGSSENNVQGRRKSLLFAAIAGGLILICVVAFWMYSSTYESTDDAQVDGHISGITSRVDGVVKAIHVEENQSIQAGQLIAEIDPRDYQAAIEQAQ